MTLNEQVTNDKTEKFLTPKELVLKIQEIYGLPVKYRRIIEIRMHSEEHRDGMFINGLARASDVFSWMKNNPGFKYKRYTPCIL